MSGKLNEWWRRLREPGAREKLRTFWTLGRVAHLPTVWSNCLAGWLLSGGGGVFRFGALCAGASCLYLGGSFLQDVCDTGYDRAHRRERPIAAGRIDQGTVLLMSVGWFLCGLLLLVALGKVAAVLTVGLLATTLLYPVAHRTMPLAPAVFGLRRCLGYWIAGAAAPDGLGGLAVWSGLSLGCYVAGAAYLGNREVTPRCPQPFACALLAVPLLLAALANGPGYRASAAAVALAFVAWVLWSLRFAYWAKHRSVNLMVAGLGAGIALVDCLAIAGGSAWGALCWPCFAATLVLQRFVPDA